MREHAVILTYPGHFFLTQLTIRSVQKHIKPKDITVIVDDIAYSAWDTYVDDCKSFYSGCDVIHTTQFDFINNKPFKGNPWMRQQLIKLSLHQILPFDRWFFTDGDIEFYSNIPVDITPYTIATIPIDVWKSWDTAPLEDKETLLMSNYINYMLGLEDFWELPVKCNKTKPNQVISTSGVPFRDMTKERLQDLEDFVFKRFGRNHSQVHQEIKLDRTKAMTEWELMEAFRYYIRGEGLNFVRISPTAINTVQYDTNDLKFLMHHLNDCELGKKWFNAQGIEINEEIWQKIPEKRY
jgi:hypothetical protein